MLRRGTSLSRCTMPAPLDVGRIACRTPDTLHRLQDGTLCRCPSLLGSKRMAMAATAGSGQVVSREEERRVIFASSLGTVFEWYDFYLYATLAPFFAALFFPPGNETAALLSAFAAYAAGFLVRPFGA